VKTSPLIFVWPGHEPLGRTLAADLPGEVVALERRQFPDGETYLRVPVDCTGRQCVVLVSLDRPDAKAVPVMLLAETLRDLGAASVGLLSPYLAYMRQDRRFHSGEAVTSRYFGKFLSARFDWLVTVDPHLHRYASLNEIFTIPSRVVHAAGVIASWIASHVEKPVLIGPDSESEQWVTDVARRAGAPHVVLQKSRHGDRDVEVSVPQVERWRDYRPVLVDDIVSTARTMIETVKHLKRADLLPPVCVGVHAVFAGDAYADLLRAGAARIVTTNTIPHDSNALDIGPETVAAVRELLAGVNR
jgi:ribose-phosphate pyrophosphokinase